MNASLSNATQVGWIDSTDQSHGNNTRIDGIANVRACRQPSNNTIRKWAVYFVCLNLQPTHPETKCFDINKAILCYGIQSANTVADELIQTTSYHKKWRWFRRDEMKIIQRTLESSEHKFIEHFIFLVVVVVVFLIPCTKEKNLIEAGLHTLTNNSLNSWFFFLKIFGWGF